MRAVRPPAFADGPVPRPWLPWAMAGAAAGCVTGFFVFVLSAQALADKPGLFAVVLAAFLVMVAGLIAVLALGASFITEAPLQVRTPPTIQGALQVALRPGRSGRPGPMPPAVGAQWVAPLARAVAGTMAAGSSRLMVLAARDRLIHGVPVFTFRWTMTGSDNPTAVRANQRAAFRAVRVRLAQPTRPQRIGPVLLIPGSIRPDQPIGDECTAGWLDPASARLLNSPTVRRALLPLGGSWVAIHRTAVVVHDQDLGRGTKPLPHRVDATIALARAIDTTLAGLSGPPSPSASGPPSPVRMPPPSLVRTPTPGPARTPPPSLVRTPTSAPARPPAASPPARTPAPPIPPAPGWAPPFPPIPGPPFPGPAAQGPPAYVPAGQLPVPATDGPPAQLPRPPADDPTARLGYPPADGPTAQLVHPAADGPTAQVPLRPAPVSPADPPTVQLPAPESATVQLPPRPPA
ncbi:hypothetical protein GCM10009765_60560 [Fodinicola feengrottensis]|uniref:Uncharacterized protein n=2 Tax=Fodinicola feengrottensis TaxID=435914 RepID=A0ABP4UDD1_9ACTN